MTVRAEVHALPGQRAAEPALLALEALGERLQRPAGAVARRRRPADLVVHERRDVVLQQLPEVLDDELGSAGLAVLHEPLVDADDVDQLVGEVVLGALTVVQRDGGTRRHRRHRQHGQNHPLGSGAFGVDAERLEVLAGDVLEPVADVRGHQLVHVLGSEVGAERGLDGLAVVASRSELAREDLVDAADLDVGLLGELLRADAVVLVVVAVRLHRRRDALR